MKAWPSAEKSPVRESEAPIVIGVELAGDELAAPVELAGLELAAVLLLLLLPPLLHAARTPTESATAPSAMAFLENQGRGALTPGSSFLIGHDCSGSGPPDASGDPPSVVMQASSARRA